MRGASSLPSLSRSHPCRADLRHTTRQKRKKSVGLPLSPVGKLTNSVVRSKQSAIKMTLERLKGNESRGKANQFRDVGRDILMEG